MNKKTTQRASEKLRQVWGYESFREGQKEAIQSILNGRDTLILFPTGGGKSLCYQVPALLLDGLTVVISPLIALMQNQVQQLHERDISATFINSTLSAQEVEQRLINARNGLYELLYCAPERLDTTIWRAEMPALNIAMIAIDEAHCISEWGHDFRPSYRKIRPALEPIADSVRWMALTATATPEVRDDIMENLQFEDPAIIATGFQRPNLKWWVIESPKKDRNLLRGIRKAPRGSGIVYAGTRNNCERLARLIQEKTGVRAAAYHAGVESRRRKKIQEEWLGGALPLVVATTAFGMGIDKADCRYVIHYRTPYSLEAYYQQAGRAGRDGQESYPLLLFKPADVKLAAKRIRNSYPSKDQLQKTYDALCDALDLAVGSVEDELRSLSISALQKRAQLSPRIVQSGMSSLQHLGIIEMTEQWHPQVGIYFEVNPDYLHEKINRESNQRKAEFLDRLFRLFGGSAFIKMKYLDQKYLEEKLNVNKNGLIKGLQVLQNHDQILEFQAPGAYPLVRPIEARVRTLNISNNKLKQHRDSLLKKLDYMLGYIQTDRCREQYIRTYFGEKDVPPCGHCDNCLKSSNLVEEGPSVYQVKSLKKLLSQTPLNLDEIKRETSLNKRQIERVLSYLLRENKIKLKGETYRWIG